MKEVGILAAVLLIGIIVALLYTAGRQISIRRARRQPWVLEENSLPGPNYGYLLFEAVRGHERLELDRLAMTGDWTMKIYQVRSECAQELKELNNGAHPHDVLGQRASRKMIP